MTLKWYCIKWCLDDTVQNTLIKSRFKFQARLNFKKSVANFINSPKDVHIISIDIRN